MLPDGPGAGREQAGECAAHLKRGVGMGRFRAQVLRWLIRHPNFGAGAIALLAVLLVLMVAGEGRCDEPKTTVVKPLVVYTMSVGADWASTKYALDRGAHEANPLFRGSSGKRALLMGVQAAVLTATDVQLQRTGHPRWAKAMRIGVPVLRGLVVVHNIRQGWKAGER